MNDHTTSVSSTVTDNLKHGKGRNSHILLVPQPSDDPRVRAFSPIQSVHSSSLVRCTGSSQLAYLEEGSLLHLALLDQFVTLANSSSTPLTLCFAAGLVGAVGPLLAPGYVFLAGEWGVSVPKVAATNGALILALGAMVRSRFLLKG